MNITDKMLKYSPDMYCCIDRDGYFVKVSEACEHLLGYPAHELEGKAYIDFVHPHDKAKTQDAANLVMQGHRNMVFENNYVSKGGDTVPIRWTGNWIEAEELLFCSARNATELVKGRKKLEESIQRYRALFENNPDVVFLESVDELITDVNQAFCDTFHLKKQDVTGKTAAAFLPLDMASVNKRSFEQALAGSILRFDLNCEATEQQPKTFDVVKFPVVANNQVIGVQTIAKDITPIVRSFETISKQAQKLNNIFESITDAFIMLDRDWQITLINSTAESILGLDRKTSVGKSLKEVYPPHQFDHFYRHYFYALETGKAVHFEAYYEEHSIWLEVKAFPSKEGLSIYFDDVTEKIKAREELEKLSLVASRTDNGVIITDAAGLTVWVNEGFTHMMGYTLAEMQGKKPGDLLQGADTDRQTIRWIGEKLRKGTHFSAKLLNYTKEGKKLWVSMDITPIRDENDSITQFIAIQRDITFRMEAEEKQLQMTKDLYRQNRDLQQFTYIVSHNLRAPVANALGLASLLTKSDKESDLFDYALSSLKKSVVQMDTVLHDVNRILSIRDKQDLLDTEQVVLQDVFKQAYTLMQEEMLYCGGKVTVELDECPTVKANRAYLHSIFYNLISNAIKYRSDERHLHIKVNCFKNEEGFHVISFADNGIGFDMERAGEDVFKLYKRFHTHSATKGRGIGLFLVKTHVEVMGGKIEVRSHVNEGTEFLIYLP